MKPNFTDEEKEMFGLQREILESFYVAERG